MRSYLCAFLFLVLPIISICDVWRLSETVQEEDANGCKKFADLAAARPLVGSSTHTKRRNAKLQLYHDLRNCIVNGDGSHCEKLLAIDAIVAQSDAS